MAIRSVFTGVAKYPYYEQVDVSTVWFGGFALSQKRKCELGLHMNFNAAYPDIKVLEISSASLQSLGAKLSAVKLSKFTQKGVTSLESAFQCSRIYSDGVRRVGPFPEYLFLPGKKCKKIVKEASLGMHSYEYLFDGMTFYAPEFHISLFYDYLYLNALLEPENQAVREELLSSSFLAFTDLATLALNSQARSAAIFRGLDMAGLIDEVRDYHAYHRLFLASTDGKATGPESYKNVPLLDKGRLKSLLPAVPCTVGKADIEAYYKEHCYMLTNRKEEDNYLDLQGK